jgi:hypothetical protein
LEAGSERSRACALLAASGGAYVVAEIDARRSPIGGRKQGARRRPRPLEKPLLGKADMPVAANDDVIDQVHINQRERLLERTGQRLVGA